MMNSITRNERGVALMLVLWVILVLSAIAAGVAVAARRQSTVVIALRSRAVARYAAESGITAAAAELERLFRQARMPGSPERVLGRLEEQLDRWGARTLGAGARYQVAIADLNARIDLNQADQETLLGLIGQFVDGPQAAALVDALEDWKDDDEEPRAQGAELEDYVRARSPFVPANAPLLRLDDLNRIMGFGDSLTRILAPYITVRGDGLVNVNTAPRNVLAALPELGPAGADLLITARAGGNFVTSAYEMLQDMRLSGLGRFVRGPRVITLPERILVVSRGWAEGAPLTHEIQAVFEIGDIGREDGPSLRVVHWTERDL